MAFMSPMNDVFVGNNLTKWVIFEKDGDIGWYDGLSNKTLYFITKQHKSNGTLFTMNQLGKFKPWDWVTKIPFY